MPRYELVVERPGEPPHTSDYNSRNRRHTEGDVIRLADFGNVRVIRVETIDHPMFVARLVCAPVG
ncbi:MAG: hypothetical protein ACRDON_06430 [Gaiellaceae bacterium]